MEPLLVTAARGLPTQQLPIWLMRQAGRYLPEYRKIREKHSFIEMARLPEVAAEITLQPLRRFPLDGAIIFSDILVVPEALGFPYEIVESSGPQFAQRFENRVDLAKMRDRVQAIPENLSYFYQALKLVASALPGHKTTQLTVPALLGFAGAPFTLAAYLVEGKSKTEHERVRKMARLETDLFTELLAVLEEAVVCHLTEQARAGAQMVQLFESFAGLLPQPLYQQFCIAPAKRIVARVQQATGVPVSYFSKGAGGFMDDIATVGADIISLDWSTSLAAARKTFGPKMCLQGNLDPTVLFAGPQAVVKESASILQQITGPHIFNLGHGVLPGTPLESVEALVSAVHAHPLKQGI